MELLIQPFWKLSSIWIIFNANVVFCILDGKRVYADIVDIEL